MYGFKRLMVMCLILAKINGDRRVLSQLVRNPNSVHKDPVIDISTSLMQKYLKCRLKRADAVKQAQDD